MDLVPGASPRLLAYLERLAASRDPAMQDMDGLVDALAERGFEPSAWEGLVHLEGLVGGLSLAGGRMRLGAAWPLLAPEAWQDEARGEGEGEGDAWPALEVQGHLLWLAGATPSPSVDYVADAKGGLSLWDREDRELTRLATDGLQLLEKNALLSEAARAHGDAPTLVAGAAAPEAELEALGFALAAEASDAVSAFYASEAALVRISMVKDEPETTLMGSDPALLVALAERARAVDADAPLVLQGEGPALEAALDALAGAGVEDVVTG